MRGRAGSLVHVVHRQPLSRSTSVAVVTVGSRVLVLGTTEHQVSVLTELDPDELEAELVLVPGQADDDNGGPTTIPVLVPPTSIAPETIEPTSHANRAGTRRTGSRRAVPAQRSGARRAGARRATTSPGPQSGGALTGSVLSPQTWKQALAAATGKAS